MKKEKSAGAVVVFMEKEPLYLLLKHKPGHWDFPKGHREKSETDEETARREIKEETGLTEITILPEFKEKIQYFFKLEKTLISKEVIFFIAIAKTQKIQLSFEHKEYAWLPYKDTSKKITFKNNKEILKKAREFLVHRKKRGQLSSTDEKS